MNEHDETTRVCEEPMPFGEVMRTAEAELADWQAQFASNPQRYRQPGVCCAVLPDGRKCEAAIPPPWVIKCGSIMFPVVHCPECTRSYFEREARGDQLALEAELAWLVPPDFVGWDNSKGNGKLRSAALKTLESNPGKGIVIHGETGTCKTRVMWEMVKFLVARGEKFLWRDAAELEAGGIDKECYFVRHLFIDDLGNEGKKPSFQPALLGLIRKRCDWHRPIYLSTQLDGAGFKKRFFESHAGQAVLRRLRDHSVMISSLQNTQSPDDL